MLEGAGLGINDGDDKGGFVSFERGGKGKARLVVGLGVEANDGKKVGKNVGCKKTGFGEVIMYDALSRAHPPYSVTITSP